MKREVLATTLMSIDPLNPSTFFGRTMARMPIVASAALVALAFSFGFDEPGLAVLLVALSFTALLPPFLAQRRFRRLLLSGDVERIVSIWRAASDRVPHRETTEPLITAMAFAAYGWVDEARNQLRRARTGPAWEATVEHRLFVETLLEAFSGDRTQAMAIAEELADLPLPQVGYRLRRHVVLLRTSLGALARAFAHDARAGDLEVLEHVAQSSPLVSWAMRYAAAIVAIDGEQFERAQGLIEGAPEWPTQSAFRDFHSELEGQLSMITEPKPAPDSTELDP